MNSQITEELLTTLRGIKDGKPWQFREPGGLWRLDADECPLERARIGEIRLAPPEPPTPPEGYRLLLPIEKDGQWIDGAQFLDDGEWCQNCRRGTEQGCWAMAGDIIAVPIDPPQPDSVSLTEYYNLPPWERWPKMREHWCRQIIGDRPMAECTVEMAMRDLLDMLHRDHAANQPKTEPQPDETPVKTVIIDRKNRTVTEVRPSDAPKPDPDGWIPWHGGECPVEPETMVVVKLRNGSIKDPGNARTWRWDDASSHLDIIAYRVTPPAPEYVPWSLATFPTDRPVWVTSSRCKVLALIVQTDEQGVWTKAGSAQWPDLLKDYTQVDGFPCGTLKP